MKRFIKKAFLNAFIPIMVVCGLAIADSSKVWDDTDHIILQAAKSIDVLSEGNFDITVAVDVSDARKGWVFDGTLGSLIPLTDSAVDIGSASKEVEDIFVETLTASVATNSTGPLTVTSASANALAVGRLGATTPAFNIDASASTSITGLNVASAASGSGVALSALGATNEPLKLDAKGSGDVTIQGTATGNIVAGGGLSFSTSGDTIALQEATSAAKCMGAITANGTDAVTTSTTCAVTGARIFLTRTSAPSGTAQCWVTNIVNATSFDLDCDGAETGTFQYLIIKESA